MALEVTGKYIRITLQHRGERYRFKWPEPASEASLRAAKRVQDRIKRDLEDGAFTCLDDYLPGVVQSTAFGPYALEWLKGHSASDSTRHEYRKALNRYWLPSLGHTLLSRLRPATVRAVIAAQEFPSAKTRNNAVIPLRQILRMAFLDEITAKDLSQFVTTEKHQKSPPDPFTREEADAIIEHFAVTHFGPYWEFMFYSGLRTGEAIGLRWASVDLRQGIVRVERTQSKGRSLERTKTGRVRDVRLHPRALCALKRQKAKSYLAGGHVFLTESVKPYGTEKAQRGAFTAALKKLGIRHRPQYNTRHTYATMLLMAGANPVFVAKQLGHSPVMTLTVYSNWIDSDQDAAEIGKLTTDLATDDDSEIA